MNSSDPDWSLYRSFLAALREKSLSAAARALDLPAPASGFAKDDGLRAVLLNRQSALGLGACGSDDDTGAAADPAANAAKADITIKTFQFLPKPAKAPAGTITVTNLDNTTHTFSSGTPDAPGNAIEPLRLAGPDATGTVDLEAGTYKFFCEIHTSMTGTLTVT